MEFSITRLYNLMKMDFLVHKKFLIISILSLLAICALMVFFASDGAPRGSNQVPPDAGEITFFVVLVICGCIITALTFREFRSMSQRVQYLSIPASNFEKLLSKWLYTLPLYLLLAISIFILVYTTFGYLVEYLLEVEFVPLIDLQLEYYGYSILGYFIAHSIIFFFSILFNAYPIPKILATGLVCFGIGVIVVLFLVRVIMFEYFTGFMRGSELMFSTRLPVEYMTSLDVFINKQLPYLFALIGVPFIWVITYFKMKEKEA